MKLVFSDESGDAGIRMDLGSSRYFIICYVIFYDFLEAEKVSLEIKKVRRTAFKNDYQEFHFTKDSNITKKKFFESLMILKFTSTVRLADCTKEKF